MHVLFIRLHLLFQNLIKLILLHLLFQKRTKLRIQVAAVWLKPSERNLRAIVVAMGKGAPVAGNSDSFWTTTVQYTF